MSFQWIVDNAAQLEINNQGLVSSTTTRDGTIRSVSRGGQPWLFTVTLPDGPRWTDYRENIGLAQRYDRHTQQDINFATTGMEYLFQYQGDMTPPNGNGSFNGTWTIGSDTLTITGGSGSGNRLVAGDFVQLGATGHVYQAVQTITSGTTSVKLHRPIIDASDSDDVFVGTACTFTVKAVDFPRPVIIAYKQVGWTGPFIFAEVID